MRVWGGLPDFCALVPVVGCVSYAITLLLEGPRAGIVGSTFGIRIGLVLALSPFLGALGVLVGRIARHLLVPMASAKVNNFMKWCGVAVLVSVAIVAALQASAHIQSMQSTGQGMV
jgi:hypothetical protein